MIRGYTVPGHCWRRSPLRRNKNHVCMISPPNQDIVHPRCQFHLFSDSAVVFGKPFADSEVLGGLEMTSPILRACQGSRWRSEVQATWAFLEDYSRAFKNRNCNTHVHISVLRCFTLQDVKKIAQCIIHFESAVEVLVPAERRGNEY